MTNRSVAFLGFW